MTGTPGTDRSFVARTLNRSGKPALIWLAPPFLAFYGVSAGLFAVVLAQDGSGAHTSWSIDASPNVPVLPLALPLLASLCVVSCAGAYGFLRERVWARPVVAHGLLAFNIAGLIMIVLFSQSAKADLAAADWGGAGFAGATYLYLYHYPSVVRYYERLNAESANGAHRHYPGSAS